MANDRDKELPLIVAEILIELHEVRTDIKEMRGDIGEVKQHLAHLTLAYDRQSQELSEVARAVRAQTDGMHKLTHMMMELVQTNHQVLEQRLDKHENRLKRLEDGQ